MRPSAESSHATIEVELAFVERGLVRRSRIELPDGATLADAIARFRARGDVGDEIVAGRTAAVFGRAREAAYRLHDGDRVELLAALEVDPKVARRARVGERRAAAPRDKWRGPG